MNDNYDNSESGQAITEETMSAYYHGLFDAVLVGMGKDELDHGSAVAVLLAVAGAIASDLGEAGIQVLEQQAAHKIDYMRRSRAAYEAATGQGRLQ